MRRQIFGSLILSAGLCAPPISAAWATTVGPLLELNVGPAGTPQRAPVLAWDASRNTYVIVWQDERNASNGTDLFAARIAIDGSLHPNDSSGCAIVTNAGQRTGDETQPAIIALPGGDVAIAWREARTGVNDIFLARLDTASCTASSNTAVTSGADAETSPTLSLSAQSLLVSYPVALVSGGQVVRGRRYQPNLTPLDAAASLLAPSGAARPSALGLGNDHALAWDLNGDAFVRVVPGTGPIGPASRTLSSANLSQSRVSLAALNAGQVVAMWQDARLGVSQEDIYAQRLSATATLVGAETGLSLAAAAQLSPRAAGDGNLAFALWQDRRHSTINAIIYGSRLDPSTGASLDPQGLPVLALTGNAFEANIVKGPGADYLVAAVRFGSPSRVFYRLLRDELPVGVLTAPAAAPAAADGTTSVNLTFGPAVGASGLQVIDGTLYTVVLGQAPASLAQPDADPNAAGHQVAASQGQVFVSVRSPQAGTVQVDLTSVEGSASGAAQAVFINSPPSASQVLLTPSNPGSQSDLQLSYVFSDPDGDPESGSSIQWTRNSAVQPNYADMMSVPGSATRRGDQWRARVTPSDGSSVGPPAFSNSVTVINGSPAATSVQIVPDTDVRTGSMLNGRYTFEDPDQDPSVGTRLFWVLDNMEQADLQDVTQVPGARVLKGQTWRFEVEPSDGMSFGPRVASAALTIVNTTPIASSGADADVPERSRYTLNGSASFDQDPQDVLQYDWSQIINGTEPTVALSSTASVSPSFLAPSVQNQTVLTFQLTVFDGETNSGASRVRITVTPLEDTDGDGLDDLQEATLGSDPSRADTDRDGLDDGRELELGTGLLDQDSDDDGVRDGAEGRSCPACEDFEPEADPDGDQRIAALDPDTDDDGLFDGTELSLRGPLLAGGQAPYAYEGTDTSLSFFVADADPETSTEVQRADTDGDGLEDGAEDSNRNGRLDPGESDPKDAEDPGVPCDDTQPCPSRLVCEQGLCVRPPETDGGGQLCSPQPQSVMCCNGGCTGGQPVAAICLEPGNAEVCPVGADLCVAGACTDEAPTNPAPASSCTCTSTQPRWGGSILILLWGVWARRRRAQML